MPEPGTISEAVILIKPTPPIGKKYDGTFCCAAVTAEGEWLRLYLSAQSIEDAQKFNRWSRIRFKSRPSLEDSRPESRDIDSNSILKIGEMLKRERHDFLARLESSALSSATKQGKSLTLLRPRNPLFFIERKSKEELSEEQQSYDSIAKHKTSVRPQKPCAYRFKYKYSMDDGEYEGTCQDWGINAAFAKLCQSFGEAQALIRMIQLFGKEYPEKGMVFAMSTQPQSAKKWFINAIIGADEVFHMAGNCVDLVA